MIVSSFMKKKRVGLKKVNVAAIVAFLMVLISGFVFPIFRFNFFGRVQVISERTTIFNLIGEIIFGNHSFDLYYSIVIFLLVFVYIAILLMYFFNGIKWVPNIYSTHASYLSFVFMFIGLIGVFLLNSFNAIIILGFNISSVGPGPLIFAIPIIGGLYLVLRDLINKSVNI